MTYLECVKSNYAPVGMTNGVVGLVSRVSGTLEIQNATDILVCISYSGSMAKSYYLYIMASYSRTLYIGVTSNLQKRVLEHKTKAHENSFSAKYNINRLVYAEETKDVLSALEREKQLKRWRREKKVWLIEQQNPEWRDLSEDL